MEEIDLLKVKEEMLRRLVEEINGDRLRILENMQLYRGYVNVKMEIGEN